MKRKHFLAIVLSLSLVVTVGTGAFAVGYTAGAKGGPIQPLAEVLSGILPGILPASPPVGQDEKWELFLQVWEIVSQEFYQQPIDQEIHDARSYSRHAGHSWRPSHDTA